MAELKRPWVSVLCGRRKFSSEDAEKTAASDAAAAPPGNESCDTPEQHAFLRAVTGRTPSDHTPLTSEQQTWLAYLHRQIIAYPVDVLRQLITGLEQPAVATLPPDVLLREMFLFLARLAEIVARDHFLSIDRASQILSEAPYHVLMPVAVEAALRNQTRNLLFECLSWITMLYSVQRQLDTNNLLLDNDQCPSIDHTKPADHAERPLCELLQEFGPLLPVKETAVAATGNDSTFQADSLYVSLLNAATLSQLGAITITWVDNISAHLCFDPEARRLLLFRHPSFIEVHRFKSTSLARILDDYYDEFNRPTAFTAGTYLREIRRSYALIFADESASRSVYTSSRLRRPLRAMGPIDPYLDELCGMSPPHAPLSASSSSASAGHSLPRGTERNSYSKTTDFPILAARLSLLQDYILRQNPKSLRMIWRDRRNPSQWWTFWAVVWIGGTGIVLSLVQTLLSAMQVYYAAREKN